MAYRHLLLLGESDTGGAKLDHIDLGPARATATITGRVLEYLRSADRIIETTLAPAALLAARFGLLPAGTNAAELESLLGFFYRLPRLPKLANPGVLRRALAEGVEKGLFGLASGSAWDAEDAVLRFAQTLTLPRSSSSPAPGSCARQPSKRCLPGGRRPSPRHRPVRSLRSPRASFPGRRLRNPTTGAPRPRSVPALPVPSRALRSTSGTCQQVRCGMS